MVPGLLKQSRVVTHLDRAMIRIVIALLVIFAFATTPAFGEAPYMATGFKIGEVTDTEAIVWVRLTATEERVDFGGPMPEVTYTLADTGEPLEGMEYRRRRADAVPTVEFPGGSSIDTLEGAVPGAMGVVRVRYKTEEDGEFKLTPWLEVDPAADYTRQFHLQDLLPASRYQLEVEYGAGKDQDLKILAGSFRTAPSADTAAAVTFTVTTGQRYPDLDSKDGFRIYRVMQEMDPEFFVHTGDILYYDEFGKTTDLANWHWQRIYSLNSLVDFHRHVPSYFIKDDHDTLMNDSWPTMETHFMGEMTFEDGIRIFREQVPMGEKTYRTVRWGKDLQIWLVEGRDFRSANDMEDGPDKTIWGAEQMAWFKRTVQESDATFRILISPTPVVGPDRGNKNDNHANEGFTYEGNMLREFIASQDNMFVVCGDRHWQYVSVDSTHGVKEYSSGPTSDEHAGGWKNDMIRPEHRYLNVIGGFLALTIDREKDRPLLIARHHAVDGKVLNEDRVTAE
jgi:alkaline phosphatase D